jgi:hypothetical protein
MADTNQIIIYGASDDCIEIEGAVYDEFSVFGQRTIGTVILEAPEGTVMEVTLEYGPNDWEITLPDQPESWGGWPVKFGAIPDGSEGQAIFIDAPAGTTVRLK